MQGLPNLLRAAGYWTGLIGKFHVGPASSFNFHEVLTKGTGGNRDVAAMARLARSLPAAEESLVLAVAGLHLSGEPRNHELLDRGATLIGAARTAPRYRLYALPSGAPGLVRDDADGAAIDLDDKEAFFATYDAPRCLEGGRRCLVPSPAPATPTR